MDTSEHIINQEKIDSVFTERRSFKRWFIDHQIGIYSTVVFHLLVFLILAVNKIRLISDENFIAEIEFVPLVPDEQKPEELSKAEEEKLKQELEQMLKDLPPQDIKVPNLVSNAAVDGKASGRSSGENVSFFSQVNSATLKEREKVKIEVAKVKEKQAVGDVPVESNQAPAGGEAYKGPSVISYFLEGRIALPPIPVPAYKCLKGGDITVLIEVNQTGYVINASVDVSKSSRDECLREAAVQAAFQARFSTGERTGNQKGNIVYRFFSQ